MAIEIINEEPVRITQAEMERLWPEYRSSQKYTTRPVSFETWLRDRLKRKDKLTINPFRSPIHY